MPAQQTSTTPPSDSTAPTDASAKRIACAQVYGGTQAINVPIDMPGIEGYLYSQPCQSRRGGDIYYMSICGSGILSRVCVADVVGHGEDVAVVSEETHSLLRRSMNWTDHRRVLRQLNHALVKKGLRSLTTSAMLTYFPPTRSLSFSYAGHPPMWRYSAAKGTWSPMKVPSSVQESSQFADIPLAVDEAAVFSRSRVRAAVVDLIVLFTDGVVDALDQSSTRFGDDRLSQALHSIERPTPRLVTERVADRLRDFCGVDRFDHDDVTLLALRMTPFSRGDTARALLSNRLLRPFRRRASDPSFSRS